jgi:hypothetical protein
VLFLRSLGVYHSSKYLQDDIAFFFSGISPFTGQPADYLSCLVSLVIRSVYTAWTQLALKFSETPPTHTPNVRSLPLQVRLLDAWRQGGWWLHVTTKKLETDISKKQGSAKAEAMGLFHLFSSFIQDRSRVQRHCISQFLMLIEKHELTYPSEVFANFVVRIRDELFTLFSEHRPSKAYLVKILKELAGSTLLNKEWAQMTELQMDKYSEYDDQVAKPSEPNLRHWQLDLYSKLIHSQAKDTMRQTLYKIAKSGVDRQYLKQVSEAKQKDVAQKAKKRKGAVSHTSTADEKE